MSRGLICDQCGTVLAVNDRGDSMSGENAGWLEVRTAFGRYDLCTRACAADLLDERSFIEAHDAELEAITDIARSIAETAEDDDPEP